MEKVLEYLSQTVTDMFARGRSSAEIEALVEGFHSEQTPVARTVEFSTNMPARMVIKAINMVLSPDFQVAIDVPRRTISATLRRDFPVRPPWLDMIKSARRDWSFHIKLAADVNRHGRVSLSMAPSLDAWINHVRSEVLKRLSAIPSQEIELERIAEEALARSFSQDLGADLVLAPGETLDGPYTGTLRDYSHCATRNEIRDLEQAAGGVLPLGRYGFNHPRLGYQAGPLLYLSPIANKTKKAQGERPALREHQGTLICAPPNSGKTELIVRWARAANAAAYNLLIVDVKGNLLSKLCDRYEWKGELYHVTSDPLVTPGETGRFPCHALNVLDGIDPLSPLALRHVRQLAEALLPGEGLEQGESRVWRNNWLNWLTALIHIALLEDFYYPFTDRKVDLGDIYDLASDEDRVIDAIRKIDAREREYLAAGHVPVTPNLRSWFSDIAALLPQIEIVAEDSALGRRALKGSRSEFSYRWLTEQVVGGLRPFREYGLLHNKVSGMRDRPQFSLEWLTGLDDELQPVSGRQTTVVLAAREQELDEAKTLLTLAIIKLEQAFYDRIPHAGTGKLTPVLLLLDETRRIRNFDVKDYVSYAREAEAGCVVVYQALEQIGDDKKIRQLLLTIGCQIYLGSLSSSTAKHFIDCLGTRDRRNFTITTGGSDGAAGLQIGNPQIPFFSTGDLQALPSGDYPALVYLREQPARAPILVNMSRSQLGDPA
jgi:hypothetical protein